MTIEPYTNEAYEEAYTKPDMPSGVQIMNFVETYLEYFAKWPDAHTRRTVALWIVHSHARTDKGDLIWPSTPRLWFKSVKPGSGKSWAMAITSFLCPKAELFIEPSEPAVIHTVGKEKGTLFLDELDQLFNAPNRKTAVKAIMNGGYTKIPPTTWPRVRNGKVEKIPTFGALAFAGLEELETGSNGHMRALLTRCIRVHMNRAPDNYSSPDFGEDEWDIAVNLRGLIAAWAADNLDALKANKPDMPEGVGNRLAQLWKPLFSVADMLGGNIPQLARKSCVSLTKTATNGMCPEVANQVAAELSGLMSHWEAPKAIEGEGEAGKPDLPDLSKFQAVKPRESDIADTASAAPRAIVPTDTRGRLLATLEQHGELDGKDLARLSGVAYGNTRVTCGRMRDDGTLVQSDRGKWDIVPGHEPIVVKDHRAAHILS